MILLLQNALQKGPAIAAFKLEVRSHDIPAISCFTGEKFKQGIIVKESFRKRASRGLPDPLEEAIEASKDPPNVNMNVLALSSSVSPRRRGRNGLAAKPTPAVVASRIRSGTMGSWPWKVS